MATPSRAWFSIAILPLLAGAALVAHSCATMRDDVEGMQRVLVPGENDVRLGQGDWVFYGESESTVDGVPYDNGGFTVTCALSDADGRDLHLDAVSSHTHYTMFGYAGDSMFEANVPADGTYRFTCSGMGGPFVIAIGRGLGASIVVLVLGILGSLALTGATIAVVAVWRSRRRRAKPMVPVAGSLRPPYS